MLKRNPTDWYNQAMARPVNVPEETLAKRIELAEKLRALSVQAGVTPTAEMIADEMLLMTGKMANEEFNQYLLCKYGQ